MPSRIARFCRDHLLTSGPLDLAALHAAARAAGVTAARNPGSIAESLRYDRALLRRPDGRFDTARRVLAGSALTHRVRYSTSERDQLWAGRELAPFDLLLDPEGLPLASGGVLRRSKFDPLIWGGPPGWLPSVDASQLLSLRWTGSELAVTPAVVSRDDVAERICLLRTVLARHRDRPVSRWGVGVAALGELVLGALVEVPDLLHVALPPLDELLPLPAQDRLSYGWADNVPASGIGAAVESELGPRPGQPGASLRLDLPVPLAHELRRRADLLGIPTVDYAVQVLSAEAWRAAPPSARYPPAQAIAPPYDLDSGSTAPGWPDPSAPLSLPDPPVVADVVPLHSEPDDKSRR